MVDGFSSANPILARGFQIAAVPKAPSETTSNKKSSAQVNCEAKGGRWDAVNKVCILPEKTEEPTTTSRNTYSVGGKQYTKEEYQAIKAAAGFDVGSGRAVTPEEQAVADRLNTTPEQRAVQEERARLTQEESPERRELQIEPSGLEQVPVIGPLARKLFDIIPGLDEDAKRALTLRPEEQRTAALTEIERQEIEKGLTANEKFGSFVEAIPIAGTLISKYASGLIETPSGNTREVTLNIRRERSRISNIETNVKLGYLPVSVAQEQITDIEENVQRLESRMRLLINNSPQLKFNSDGVNTIETEVLRTKEKIFQAKQNILTGATRDPTELELYQRLLSEGETEE